MGKLKAGLYVVVTLSLCFLTNKSKAQSALLGQGEKGLLTEAGIGFSEGFSGPVFGLGYSFNGMTGIGASYGILSTKGEELYSFSAGVNGFIMKEYAGDAANVEISAAFQRGFRNRAESYQSLFAFSGSVSKSVNSDRDFSLIPRAGFTYGIIIATRKEYQNNSSGGNLTAFNLDVLFGIPLARNFKLTVNPGISFLISESVSSGFVSSGILIH